MNTLVKVAKGDRHLFFGTFDRVAIRYDKYKGNHAYVIITNIRDEYGNYISNYASFDYIKGFSSLNLQPGDTVSFRARYVACQKSYDAMPGFPNTYANVYYRLMNPSKVTKLISPVKPLTQYSHCKIQINPTRR